MRLDDCEYAVVDVETTGLYPDRYDRVVEIAVIRLDLSGCVTGEFVTLVNPLRDIGPTDTHGIMARDIRRAPTFREIAGNVLALLRGAVFVAHNAAFDAQFVRRELERADFLVPHFPRLCTLALSCEVKPNLRGRSLERVCAQFDIPLERAHDAYCDASATAQLLIKCLTRLRERGVANTEDLGISEEQLLRPAWPVTNPSGRSLRRQDVAALSCGEPSPLAELIGLLPASGDNSLETRSYFAVLDRALEDLDLTLDESMELYRVANECGISRSVLRRAHEEYLASLVSAALETGRFTDRLQRDLDRVRMLLDVPPDTYAQMLKSQVLQPSAEVADSARNQLRGKRICFTGTMHHPKTGEPVHRDAVAGLAERAGIVVLPRVCQDLDFLVAEDPSTLSNKAKTARRYGVRILAESTFWRFLGPLPDKDLRELRSSVMSSGQGARGLTPLIRSRPKLQETPRHSLGENVCPRAPAAGPLVGKTVVVTGTLQRYTRSEIEALIKEHGGKASSSVSRKTDFVVAGAEAGSKLDKARALGVRVLSEAEFEALLAGP